MFQNSQGSWYELNALFDWKVDDKSLMDQQPTIKVKFLGAIEKEFDAVVYSEDQDRGTGTNYTFDSYNAKVTVPAGTFKDNEGDYTVEVVLTYKDDVVTVLDSFKSQPWKYTGENITRIGKTSNGQQRKRKKKVYYYVVAWSSTTYGVWEGRYTLLSEADSGDNRVMSGRILGSPGEEHGPTLEKVRAAAYAEKDKDPDATYSGDPGY
jgi:hypothetical protein